MIGGSVTGQRTFEETLREVLTVLRARAECRFQTLLRSAKEQTQNQPLLRLRHVAPTFCGQRWPRSQHFAHGHVLFGDLAKMLEQLQSHSLVFVSTCHSGVCPAPGGNAGGVLRGVKKKISKNTLYVF